MQFVGQQASLLCIANMLVSACNLKFKTCDISKCFVCHICIYKLHLLHAVWPRPKLCGHYDITAACCKKDRFAGRHPHTGKPKPRILLALLQQRFLPYCVLQTSGCKFCSMSLAYCLLHSRHHCYACMQVCSAVLCQTRHQGVSSVSRSFTQKLVFVVCPTLQGNPIDTSPLATQPLCQPSASIMKPAKQISHFGAEVNIVLVVFTHRVKQFQEESGGDPSTLLIPALLNAKVQLSPSMPC